MRAVMDTCHPDASVPLGMPRDGPKRRRLTREKWKAKKARAAPQAEIDRVQTAQRAETR